jgi:CubicO group peptidase (beta-lactamase class C family)
MFTGERATTYDAIHELDDTGVIPGTATLIDHRGDVHIDAYGVADLATGAPVREDAIFRIQSMTKPVLTVATMQLVERGDLRLDDPVERWLPELANRSVLRTPHSELDDVVPAKRPITVDDLLTNRSGYGVVMSDTRMTRALVEHRVDVGPTPRLEPSDAWLARLAQLPLIHQPGEGWRYHTSFDILGILISRVTGTGQDDHLTQAIFDPLGMPDTAMFVEGERASRLVAAYHHDDDGSLVEDEPAGGGYHVGIPPFDVSRGELVSTVRDYHRFASMLMRGGELDGVRLLSPESVATMTRDHIAPAQKDPDAFFPGYWETNGWGYGVGVSTAPDAYGDPGRYSWMGGYGTAWFNDPAVDLIGIAFTQVLLDEGTLGAIDAFYRAAYGSLDAP